MDTYSWRMAGWGSNVNSEEPLPAKPTDRMEPRQERRFTESTETNKAQ